MKIAFLSTFFPYRGGIAQFNASLYRAFEQQGHQVKAFTFTRQYPDILFPGTSQLVQPGDIADEIPAERVLDSINPFTYLRSARQIEKFAPDLVIMKFWMPFLGPALGSVAHLLKKKTKIITLIDNAIPHEKRIGDLAFTKYFLRANHGFVVMSNKVKEDLLQLQPQAKILFHPHPLYNHFGANMDQQEARQHLSIGADKKVILFFGFIRDYKGLDLLIEAMKNTPEDYVLLIAGEVYGNFESYRQQINAAGLEQKIVLHVRYISDNEVPLFFSAADVCVLPYKSATQSGITSIAFHFNVPIIATDVGGLQESITHNSTGLIVEKPDALLIHESLKKYFAHHFKAQFVANIERYKQQLSWEHLATETLAFSKTL